MRRFFIGLTIAAMAAIGTGWAFAGDPEIAKLVIAKLNEQKQSGQLKGFKIGVSVKDGQVWLKGHTSSPEQKAQVTALIQHVPGVTRVVDEISVGPAASAAAPTPAVAAAPAKPWTSLLGGGEPTPAKTTTASSRRVSREAPQPALAPAPVAIQAAAPEQTRALNASQSVAMGGEPSVAVHPLPVATAEYRGQSALQAQAQAIPADAPAMNARLTATQEPYQPNAQAQSRRAQAEPNYEGQLQPTPARQPARSALAQPRPQQQYYQPVQPVPTAHANPRYPAMPMAYAQARQANYQPGMEGLGQPIPAYNPAMGGGVAPARYDHPRMPGYAWPSYAAYPNYAAVTYPRQYSPTAWPYIGPFYPYPQVPLGWRKVTLEWDDGWWMLDFKQK